MSAWLKVGLVVPRRAATRGRAAGEAEEVACACGQSVLDTWPDLEPLHAQHIPKARPDRRAAPAQVLPVTEGGATAGVVTLAPRERLHVREHTNPLPVQGSIKLYSQVRYTVTGGPTAREVVLRMPCTVTMWEDYRRRMGTTIVGLGAAGVCLSEKGRKNMYRTLERGEDGQEQWCWQQGISWMQSAGGDPLPDSALNQFRQWCDRRPVEPAQAVSEAVVPKGSAKAPTAPEAVRQGPTSGKAKAAPAKGKRVVPPPAEGDSQGKRSRKGPEGVELPGRSAGEMEGVTTADTGRSVRAEVQAVVREEHAALKEFLAAHLGSVSELKKEIMTLRRDNSTLQAENRRLQKELTSSFQQQRMLTEELGQRQEAIDKGSTDALSLRQQVQGPPMCCGSRRATKVPFCLPAQCTVCPSVSSSFVGSAQDCVPSGARGEGHSWHPSYLGRVLMA